MFKKIKDNFSFFENEIKELFLQKNGIKYFFFIFITYLLGYFALIRANVYYLDDLRRILRINIGWDNFSRYSSNAIAKWVNMSGTSDLVLLDIAPLTQIIAMLLLSISSLIILRAFKIKSIYIGLLATAIIGLSPFFLENMSYKMDATYMAIAVFSAIFPFLFIQNKYVFSIVGILSLLLMYTTYQPANSVFILLTIFIVLDCYLEHKTFKNSLYLLMQCFGVFVISTLIYKFFILNEVNNYVSSQMLGGRELVSGLNINITKYFTIIYNSFANTILAKIALFSVISLPIVIFLKTKNILSALLSLVTIVIAALVSYGLYTVLSKPLFDARALNGVGVFFALVLLLLIKYSEHYIHKLYQFTVIVFVYNLFVIAYAYGNGLAAQYYYNDFRANALIQDLNANYKNMRQYSIYIRNDKIIAPRNEIAIKTFPVLNMLIQEGNQGHWIWTALYNYWGKVNYNFVINQCANENNVIVSKLDTDMYSVNVYDNKCMIITHHKY